GTVTQKVRQACLRISPRNSTTCSAMRAGLGKMNSLTWKAEQIACHSATMMNKSSHGARRFIKLLQTDQADAADPASPGRWCRPLEGAAEGRRGWSRYIRAAHARCR